VSDLVLDASLALQWFLVDEADRKYSLSVLSSLSEKQAVVPVLWFYEVGNGLLMAYRRKRIALEQIDGFLTRLKNLPIEAASLAPAEVLDLPVLAQTHILRTMMPPILRSHYVWVCLSQRATPLSAGPPPQQPCQSSSPSAPSGRLVDTHQEKQRDDGGRLQVRAESQQTAIAILHHELPLVPGHVAKSPSEFHALGGVLGIKCVGVFNDEVCVEQFVRVFVRIGCGRLGAAEMNHLLVARHDGIDRRILPRPQTCEAKLACVIGERCGNVHGEEHGCNLADHGPSLLQM
jgi:hypothetical protein